MNIEKIILNINNKKELLKLKYSMIEKLVRYNLCTIVMSLSLGSLSLYDLYQKHSNSDRIEKYSIQTESDISKNIIEYNQMVETLSLEIHDNMQESMKNLEITEVSTEEKIEYILEKYDLTEEQFHILLCIILSEAKPYDLNTGTEDDYMFSYIDSYATTNTIDNRTQSITWVDYIDSLLDEGSATNIYYQATASGQFSGYLNGNYKKFLDIDITVYPAYQAVIDYLYTGEPMHNYLCFRSWNSSEEGKEHFVEGGNRYFNELTDEDRIINENTNMIIANIKELLR